MQSNKVYGLFNSKVLIISAFVSCPVAICIKYLNFNLPAKFDVSAMIPDFELSVVTPTPAPAPKEVELVLPTFEVVTSSPNKLLAGVKPAVEV